MVSVTSPHLVGDEPGRHALGSTLTLTLHEVSEAFPTQARSRELRAS